MSRVLSVNPLYIPRLAVIGVGLIGGSLSLALREAGARGVECVAVARTPSPDIRQDG